MSLTSVAMLDYSTYIVYKKYKRLSSGIYKVKILPNLKQKYLLWNVQYSHRLDKPVLIQ